MLCKYNIIRVKRTSVEHEVLKTVLSSIRAQRVNYWVPISTVSCYYT